MLSIEGRLSAGTQAGKGEPSAPRVPVVEKPWPRDTSPQLLETVCPSQVQLVNSILFANGPGSESRSGLLSYFLLTLGFIGPSLSELNSPSETSAWILLPPVNQNSSHLVDRLIGWYYDNKACVDVI